MRRAAAFGALLAIATLVSACGGSGGGPSHGYSPGGGSSPSPTPTLIGAGCPSPVAGSVIYASPNPLTVNVAQNATLRVCEANYTGSFRASSSNSTMCVITAGPIVQTFNLYGAFAGTCTITIFDSFNNLLQVPTTVG